MNSQIAENTCLSFAVIQSIASCHKYMTTHYLTPFAGPCNVLMTSVTTMQFLIEIMSTSMVIKSYLNGHMINRILHKWSFHMKFIKLTKGSFNKFHMK